MALGKEQNQFLDNLLNDWLTKTESKNVLCIEAFPGTGKTYFARIFDDRITSKNYQSVFFNLSDTSFSMDDFYLGLMQKLNDADLHEVEEAWSTSKPLNNALIKLLKNHNVCITIDEFQRCQNERGVLADGIQKLIEEVSKEPTKGKIVFLTNQAPERGKWSGHSDIRPYPPLSETEAIAYFNELAANDPLSIVIPENRKPDIINRVLRKNPRAINILAGKLVSGTLDELMNDISEYLETDLEMTVEMLNELEHQIIKQSLDRLEDDEQRTLENLSVIRKPFRKEAIERMEQNQTISLRIRQRLAGIFFMEKQSGDWYALHPIVTDICRNKLAKDEKRFMRAHNQSATYYTRHFKQKEPKGNRLGEYYVEAIFHLTRAKNAEEIRNTTTAFSDMIHATIQAVTPVPKDSEILDQRIEMLTAYLGNGGAPSIEFHLARCLRQRGNEGDVERALTHAIRAEKASILPQNWLLRIELEKEINGADTAIKTALKGIEIVPADKALHTLYALCAELMSANGRADDAIALLKGAIKDNKIPADKSLASLYTLCANLMAGNGSADEAIALLKGAIKDNKIPAAQNLFTLYTLCAELMSANGRADDAIALLKGAIKDNKIPADKSLCSLYTLCANLMAGNGSADEAIALLEGAIKGNKISAAQNLFTLYLLCSELMARKGLHNQVVELVKKGIRSLPEKQGSNKLQEWLLYSYCKTKVSLYGTLVKELIVNSRQLALLEIGMLFSEEKYGEGIARGQGFTLGGTKYVPITFQLIWGLLCDERYEEARQLMISSDFVEDYNVSSLWLSCFCSVLQNDTERAIDLWKQLSPTYRQKEVSAKELVDYWWDTRNDFGPYPSNFVPYLPPSVTGFGKTLWVSSSTIEVDIKAYQSGTVAEPEQQEEPSSSNSTVLCIATEWFSRKGGLSTFNRQLCIELAKQGWSVFCYLPSHTDEEKEHASAANVTLVKAKSQIGQDEFRRLDQKPVLPDDQVPAIIIGHDRFTGPNMANLKENFFPKARTLLFIHTAPGQIEPEKQESSASTVDERERMQREVAEKCTLVAAVGPTLYLQLEHLMAAVQQRPLLARFDPGLNNPAEEIEYVFRSSIPEVYLLGRVEDYELKGVGLAVKSTAKVYDDWSGSFVKPCIRIRGVEKQQEKRFNELVCADKGESGLPVSIRLYDSDAYLIASEMKGSALVLMPSTVEGFGLVALEAISLGRPVLISEKSGLATLIKEHANEEANHWIVPVDGKGKDIEALWAKKIEGILMDRKAAGSRLKTLVEKLDAKVSWKKSVEQLMDALEVL